MTSARCSLSVPGITASILSCVVTVDITLTFETFEIIVLYVCRDVITVVSPHGFETFEIIALDVYRGVTYWGQKLTHWPGLASANDTHSDALFNDGIPVIAMQRVSGDFPCCEQQIYKTYGYIILKLEQARWPLIYIPKKQMTL